MANVDCGNNTDANSCHRRYALNVTGQPNVNESYAKYRYNWHNVANATSKTDLYCKSYFTKKKVITKYKEKEGKDKNGKKTIIKEPSEWKYEYEFPWSLACAEFKAEIPAEAYIKKITFKASMRVNSKSATVHKPIGDFRFLKLDTSKIKQETDGKTTGWHKGAWWDVDTKKTLTTEWQEFRWDIDEYDIQLAKITPEMVNSNFTGIDFIWDKAEWKGDTGNCEVYVQWIRMKVEYDMPKYELGVYDSTNRVHANTSKTPTQIKADKKFNFSVFAHNRTMSKGSKQKVKIQIPWGTKVNSVTSYYGTYDSNTGIWTVPKFIDSGKSDTDHYITFNLTPNKIGLSNISAQYVNGTGVEYWYHASQTKKNSAYNETVITADSKFHRNSVCCLNIDISNVSADKFISVHLDENIPVNGTWTLDYENSTDGVSIIGITNDPIPNTIHLKYDDGTEGNVVDVSSLPEYYDYHVALRYCFKPNFVGEYSLTAYNSEVSTGTTASFTIEDALPFKVEVRGNPPFFKFNNHRMASEVEIDESVFKCISDEHDRNMVMSDCRLTASIWEDLDYIGCIPLEHLHFDPKSTFKDTLLNSTYKNKRYMGKKLAVDEDITLNVRLHPQQVTTLQGLIEMDKPIPINANHKCFEGDALNHRGWAEVYSVKTEETNPHYYKCDIDVKYLTHNLNTRFKIDKSAKASDVDYDSQIPTVMNETWSSGNDLSFTMNDSMHDTDGISNNETYFVTDTDGTFYYAEDYSVDDEIVHINDDVRNNFSIGNKQHINIVTKQPLSHISNVAFTWSSVLVEEYRENNVSRIIRLKTKDNKTVFEYQYDNITFDEDEISADIIYRVLQSNDTLIDFNPSKRIRFRYNPTDSVHEDEDVSFDEDDIPIGESGEAHYGSTVEFQIYNNNLQVIDKGFNGREVDVSVQLPNGQYYYEVEWVNNNEDAETPYIDCTFDFVVQNTILTSTYANAFSNLVVSPYPIAKKKVAFTREAQEGTIYYYEDDNEEFSYLVEPYYQYLNGTDLVTNDGVSIFNLNYGYQIVYIQNGLVRLGFNRLNGELYLGKYDPQLDDYITVYNMRLAKFDDINLNSISDDKIEVQSSDSTFTIYRGHPYIKIKHETEDILIDTVSNSVWAEQIGTDAQSNPHYISLLNESNLLPNCVTDKLDSDCVETDWVTHNSRQSASLEWVDFPSELGLGENTFTLSSSQLTEYADEISLDDTTCSFGDYTVEFESDGTITRFENFMASKDVIQTGQVSNLIAKTTDSLGRPVKGKTVYFFEWYNPYSLGLSATPSVIQTGQSSTLTSRLKDTDGSAIKGERVYFFQELDLDYFNDGTSTQGIVVPSNASATVSNGAILYTTSTSGEKNIYYDVPITDSDNFEFECEIAQVGDPQSIAMYIKNSTTINGFWVSYENSTGKFNVGCGGSTSTNLDVGVVAVGDKIKISRIDGVLLVQKNNSTIYTKSILFGGTYYIGHYTNQNRKQYVKNIKIKKF